MNKRAAKPRPPTRRKWLFRLSALVLAPLLLLGALEGALRLCGYGFATGFFDHLSIGGKEFLVNNESFSLRFFPPQLTRWPARIMMEAQKPADTYRIFIFGESAAMGDPQIAYGAGRYLEVLLSERFPGKHFEVINTAITAINSNVILPIARDCARQQGDLWIIYMGNNEMVGPFGAATIFGAQAPPLALVRLDLAIQQTRIGQLLHAVTRKLHRESSPASWSGMEMFLPNKLRPDDPRKEVVYRNFERNLRDIAHAGLDSGARILLNTVAVNLADCPPFGSLTSTSLSAADSVQSFEQAAKTHSRAADLQFRWAECLLRLINLPAAREHFQLACDFDTLPFRTDSRLNGVIEKVGRQFASAGLDRFDAAAALAAESPSGVCGQESFYEHVHFNFDGNYRQETCERRLGLTDWNRYSAIAGVIQRLRQAPLSTQFNNAQRVHALQERLQQTRSRMTAAAETEARQVYMEALKRAPGDHFLHENFAAFLADTGDVDGAIAQWHQVRALLPQDFTVLSRLGWLLARQAKWAEAESSFREALALHPAFAPGWVGLGEIHNVQGNPALALEDYQRAQRLDPREPRTFYYIGGVLSKLNRSAEAIQSFREAIRLDPDAWEAHFALGVELGAGGHMPEARSEFEEVVRVNPTYAAAHLNLAVTFMEQKQLHDAQGELEETLRLEPGNTRARAYLGQVSTQLLQKQ